MSQDGESADTRTGVPGSEAASAPRAASSDPRGERFPPGTVLGGRYRISGPLGRGGMGEVYRADDLKLGQPVALKFLPERLERDPARLSRFLNEVRVARQVSHSNVCRMYDVTEVDGRHVLSMEYVDGEDLASLLRRIGRLPPDKAIQISRQLCAGLAAAHRLGIVHRDLKPANVMLDGQGQVRITDFGLAGAATDIRGAEVRAGTPGYMAPEQIDGTEVSARSDLYSLGLVLYELFTGAPAYDAPTAAELSRLQQETAPSRPSRLVSDLDPAVERVILRCLERDPRDRPESALAVAASLPGGDPLAAALAAGETPSPEMVAAAGEEGGLRPALAAASLALGLAGLLAVALLSPRTMLAQQVSLPRPTEALVFDARETLDELGVPGPGADSAWGWVADQDYLDRVQETTRSADRWDDLATVRPAPLRFWYRQSPRPLVPVSGSGYVSATNPPHTVSGMALVELDPQGRMLRLLVVPPERYDFHPTEPPPPAPSTPDRWEPLFRLAGLERETFLPVEPAWNPLIDCDERAAWRVRNGADGPDLRVEAGTFGARPVYFRAIAPWTEPSRMEADTESTGTRIANVILVALLFSILGGALLLARRNRRLGRGDTAGASKLSAAVFAILTASWLLCEHHVGGIDEISLFFGKMPEFVFAAAIVWVLYVALEPIVRRMWPDTLISWNRLLGGRIRDPRIARDVLLGGLAGVFCSALFFGLGDAAVALGLPRPSPTTESLVHLVGLRQSLGTVLMYQTSALFVPTAVLLILVLLRGILRNTWLPALLLIAVLVAVPALQPHDAAAGALLNTMVWSLALAVLMRLGLLAGVVMYGFIYALVHFPWTVDLSSWLAGRSLVVLIFLAGLLVWGFAVSLAGRPLVRAPALLE